MLLVLQLYISYELAKFCKSYSSCFLHMIYFLRASQICHVLSFFFFILYISYKFILDFESPTILLDFASLILFFFFILYISYDFARFLQVLFYFSSSYYIFLISLLDLSCRIIFFPPSFYIFPMSCQIVQVILSLYTSYILYVYIFEKKCQTLFSLWKPLLHSSNFPFDACKLCYFPIDIPFC